MKRRSPDIKATKTRRHEGNGFSRVAVIVGLVIVVGVFSGGTNAQPSSADPQAAAAPAPAPTQNSGTSRATGAPKLVVMLVVDQMRADYVDRFSRDWTGGLKRLVSEGAWFTNAAYPYLNTVTCPGHATIATGAFPHVHGVIQNVWWDRERRRTMSCTDDPRAAGVGYGIPVRGGDSAYRLLVPTLTDLLRAQRAAERST